MRAALTLQEVQLAPRSVDAHEVEASGGAAAPRVPRPVEDLQSPAFAGSIQAQDKHLLFVALLLLLLLLATRVEIS